VDVRCPVCDKKISGEVRDLSGTLREHLIDEHAFSGLETEDERKVRTLSGTRTEDLAPEARATVEEVARFRETRAGETAEERAVTTFSGREPYGGTEEVRSAVEQVTRFQTPRETESLDECVTRTFSETECVAIPEEAKILKEEVRQWRYPQVGPEGERGPAFKCPVCGVTMAASDDESLSAELKEHFNENHEVERAKVEMNR
jgi:hypothetical protein